MRYFTKYHLAISRDRHPYYKTGTVPIMEPACHDKREQFRITPIPARYGSFRFLLERVGQKWGWTKRPKYNGQDIGIKKRLAHPETSLFLLQHNEMTVGYCLAGLTTENPDAIPGLGSAGKLIEIENFGLFPEHTGKQYGPYFLPMIFDRLFLEYDTIYLSTRSTNHKGVVPFYQKMGMQLLHQEILLDDLIEDRAPQKQKNAEREAA